MGAIQKKSSVKLVVNNFFRESKSAVSLGRGGEKTDWCYSLGVPVHTPAA